ncbi:50S ribosomal protein L4 [Oceanotoga sp. DSM 15011]|uniref:50S ribosomal protein L4 n=1 Tax=Oceanotoga TaxID=1255275 RepID=UPI0021F47A3E|nr:MULTISPECIES: 50S ribosomal protein L4 [Oceanotoga]MDO7975647.1 50S ribosomal protein L4 [Oceanotoga teriensis]UYO99849.1 50S ribosomal protein L4 [Oceanotoga sp. DSM 15011]
MAQVEILDIKGQKVGELELKDSIFAIEPNHDVMYRYLDMQLTNKRSGNASTKTRAEVRGGGRKPWAQKHTGRARTGSIRSPLFRKGGVIFGPRPRDFKKSLNKKMKRLALRSALSVRVSEGNLIILDDIKFEAPRTKEMKVVLKNLNLETNKVLFVLPFKNENNENVKLAGRNIPKVKVIIADNPNQGKVNIDGLNIFDLINNEKVVMTKDMIAKIEEVL